MKLRHYENDGRARFITFCTHRRISILTNDLFRDILVGTIKTTRAEFAYRLIAWVIMPEHCHLIIVPGQSAGVGKIVGEIKRLSAREILGILRRSNAPVLSRLTVRRNGTERTSLWQRRCFDHNIRSAESLWEKVLYCHNNPVKRGLVRRPEDWEWSSSRWYTEKGEGKLEIDDLSPES